MIFQCHDAHKEKFFAGSTWNTFSLLVTNFLAYMCIPQYNELRNYATYILKLFTSINKLCIVVLSTRQLGVLFPMNITSEWWMHQEDYSIKNLKQHFLRYAEADWLKEKCKIQRYAIYALSISIRNNVYKASQILSNLEPCISIKPIYIKTFLIYII